MATLCTFPGRYGDLIWALPTVRALSRRLGEPVDLQIAGEFAGLASVIAPQPYIGKIYADATWGMHPPDEWRAPTLPYEDLHWTPHDHVVHLGYRGWPDTDLVRYTLNTANRAGEGSPLRRFPFLAFSELALDEPWIQVPPTGSRCDLAIAFTEVHFELKFGLSLLVLEHYARRAPDMTYAVLTPPRSRWATDTWAAGGAWHSLRALDWTGYATVLQDSVQVLSDCSAAHVLAVAMGKPVVVMEPLEARWNDIFYPLGKVGPQVTLVTGHDGLPTHDARHTAETLDRLRERMPRS